MSLVHPLALLALFVLLGLHLLFLLGPLRHSTGLPGAWRGIVDPALRPHLAALSGPSARARTALPIAIAALLVVAVARPVIDRGHDTDFAALTGRVLILDLSADAGIDSERIAVERLIALSPDIPTALVAVTRRAYQVVPLTTDGTQIRRYLAVLSPDIVPDPGQELFRGLIEADRILVGAGIAVGQSILISGAAAPTDGIASKSAGPARLVLPLATPQGWADFAQAHGAQLLSPDDMPGSVDRLRRSARTLLRAEAPDQVFELAPFLIACAAALWLLFFRRGAEA